MAKKKPDPKPMKSDKPNPFAKGGKSSDKPSKGGKGMKKGKDC